MSRVEDTIWQHLVDHHAADRVHLAVSPSRAGHKRSTLTAGLAATAGTIAGAVLLLSPATQPAYALTRHSDGRVTVSIHDLAAAVPALNARFAAMGIDETVVPVRSDCRSPTARAGALLSDPMFADPHATPATTLTFAPGRSHLSPGYSGVIAAEQLPDGKVALSVEAIKGPAPACFPTTVYTLQNSGTTENGTPIIRVSPVATTTNQPGG